MSKLTVLPAIDLRQGQVVRLQQGDPARQTTYKPNPDAVARHWLERGARWLHIVNLDGAFEVEDAPNRRALRRILEQTMPVDANLQFGGGIRTMSDMDRLFGMGINRVILGTAAARNPDLAGEAVRHFGPERILAGVDVRDGKVQVRGWTEGTNLDPLDYGSRLRELGLTLAVYTDISRDGVSRGFNAAACRAFQEQTGLNVIGAGGVATLDDVRRARDAGLTGIIIGRALYEGSVDLAQALDIAQGGT